MPLQRFTSRNKIVMGLAPILPSTSTPDYVSLKEYDTCYIVIAVLNTTTVTGSAITVKQASAVAGTGEKALAFTKVWQNIDCAAADTLAETTVTSNTFTTDTTNSKQLLYVIEINADMLDRDNGFDCIRAGTADATAAVLSVVYVLGSPRHAQANPPAAITD